MKPKLPLLPALMFLLAAAFAAGAATNDTTQPRLDSYAPPDVATYHHQAPAFSVDYPYRWHGNPPTLPGEVLNVTDVARLPSLSVSVRPMPEGATLAIVTNGAVKQLPAPGGAEVLSQQPFTLSDGTPAYQLTAQWTAPLGGGIGVQSMLISASIDGQWVLVHALDGRTANGFDAALLRAAKSLRKGQG